MKKIMMLVLALAAAAAVCASCAAKEAATEWLEYEVYNRTGENITELSIGDSRSAGRISARPQGDTREEAVIASFGVNAVLDSAGAPSLKFSYRTESGQEYETAITRKNAAISLVPGGIELTGTEGK